VSRSRSLLPFDQLLTTVPGVELTLAVVIAIDVGTNGRHRGIPPNRRRCGRRPLDGDGQGHPLPTRHFQTCRGTTAPS
jgi:hypothetical protein